MPNPAADDFATIRMHMRRLHGIVLMIDHEDPVRIFALRALANHGYRAVGTASLTEALDLIRNETIALVVIAQEMLQHNSNFIFSLREKHRNLPILINYRTHEATTQDRFSGDSHIYFMRRPFSWGMLNSEVEKLVGISATDVHTPTSRQGSGMGGGLTTTIGKLIAWGEMPNPPADRLARFNRKIAELLHVEKLDFVGNTANARALIPSGWTQEVVETEKGRFFVTLTRRSDGSTASSIALHGNRNLGIHGLPLATTIAALIARSYEKNC